MRLPSCRPGFESQAHHLCFHQFIKKLCNVEKTKINKKRPRLAHFFKKTYMRNILFLSKVEKTKIKKMAHLKVKLALDKFNRFDKIALVLIVHFLCTNFTKQPSNIM